MDGVHDMGGMHGFGAVPVDDDKPPFESAWEARVFANNIALSVHLDNIDRFRFGIESMLPRDYLSSSYYERWLASMFAFIQEKGYLDGDQLAMIRAGRVPRTTPANTLAAPPALVEAIVNVPAKESRDYSGTPRFMVGDRIKARYRHMDGHTRLPRYVRGHVGLITSDNGNQLFPDTHAATGTVEMQRLYTVEFGARELWGQDANPLDSVSLDLWEEYLDEY